MSLLSSSFDDNTLFLNPLSKSLFRDSFSLSSNYAEMNWKETPRSHVFEFDMPGLTKDDVKLDLHHNTRVLQVSGERKEDELDDKQEKWHCKERVRGGFSRQFRLPDDAKVDDDDDEIKACMSNGVLIVTIPKDDKSVKMKDGKVKQNQRREVKILGGNDDDDDDDVDDGHHGAKGIGKFVCCKA